jgi:hypothetical protein
MGKRRHESNPLPNQLIAYGGGPTITDQVAAAVAGDLVEVMPGTYVGDFTVPVGVTVRAVAPWTVFVQGNITNNGNCIDLEPLTGYIVTGTRIQHTYAETVPFSPWLLDCTLPLVCVRGDDSSINLFKTDWAGDPLGSGYHLARWCSERGIPITQAVFAGRVEDDAYTTIYHLPHVRYLFYQLGCEIASHGWLGSFTTAPTFDELWQEIVYSKGQIESWVQDGESADVLTGTGIPAWDEPPDNATLADYSTRKMGLRCNYYSIHGATNYTICNSQQKWEGIEGRLIRAHYLTSHRIDGSLTGQFVGTGSQYSSYYDMINSSSVKTLEQGALSAAELAKLQLPGARHILAFDGPGTATQVTTLAANLQALVDLRDAGKILLVNLSAIMTAIQPHAHADHPITQIPLTLNGDFEAMTGGGAALPADRNGFGWYLYEGALTVDTVTTQELIFPSETSTARARECIDVVPGATYMLQADLHKDQAGGRTVKFQPKITSTFFEYPPGSVDTADMVGAAAGAGYVVGDVLTLVGSGAAGATVRVATIDGSGGVTGVTKLTDGQNYTTGILTTTGGSGNGACTVHAIIHASAYIIYVLPNSMAWGTKASPVYNEAVDETKRTYSWVFGVHKDASPAIQLCFYCKTNAGSAGARLGYLDNVRLTRIGY